MPSAKHLRSSQARKTPRAEKISIEGRTAEELDSLSQKMEELYRDVKVPLDRYLDSRAREEKNDLKQDTFLSVWITLLKGVAVRSPVSFMKSIALNRLRDVIRKNRPRALDAAAFPGMIDDSAVPSPSAVAEFKANERMVSAVDDLMKLLPECLATEEPLDRAIFEAVQRGESYLEIARALGMAVSDVEKKAMLARKRVIYRARKIIQASG